MSLGCYLKTFLYHWRESAQSELEEQVSASWRKTPERTIPWSTLVRNGAWPALKAAQRTDYVGKSMDIDTLSERVLHRSQTLNVKILEKLTNLFLFYFLFMFAKDLHVDNSKRTSLVSRK